MDDKGSSIQAEFNQCSLPVNLQDKLADWIYWKLFRCEINHISSVKIVEVWRNKCLCSLKLVQINGVQCCD